EDQGGADCPTHLERRVAPDLGRGRSATLVAELDHRVDEDPLDQQEDRDPHEEDDQVEGVDVVRVGRPALVLRGYVARERRRGDQQGYREGAEQGRERGARAAMPGGGSQGGGIVSAASRRGGPSLRGVGGP